MSILESSFVATAAPNRLSIKPLTPALGALVENVDLARDHDDATVAAIADALEGHLVLFFEDQTISPEQQRPLPGASATSIRIRCIRDMAGYLKSWFLNTTRIVAAITMSGIPM